MFNENLKRAMTGRGLTPEALAVALAKRQVTVTAGTVSAWLRGTRTPSVSTVIEISKALDATTDELLVKS